MCVGLGTSYKMATFLVPRLQILSTTVSFVARRVNYFSVCTCLNGGQNWRVRNGMARDGLAYGPLTDFPDWSFVDGQPAPETKRRERREYRRLRESKRILGFLKEVDAGVKEDDPYKGIAKR